jgi:hypothetical protein
MMRVVMYWPVQSCSVSLIGSWDSGTLWASAGRLAAPISPAAASASAPVRKLAYVVIILIPPIPLIPPP